MAIVGWCLPTGRKIKKKSTFLRAHLFVRPDIYRFAEFVVLQLQHSSVRCKLCTNMNILRYYNACKETCNIGLLATTWDWIAQQLLENEEDNMNQAHYGSDKCWTIDRQTEFRIIPCQTDSWLFSSPNCPDSLPFELSSACSSLSPSSPRPPSSDAWILRCCWLGVGTIHQVNPISFNLSTQSSGNFSFLYLLRCVLTQRPRAVSRSHFVGTLPLSTMEQG